MEGLKERIRLGLDLQGGTQLVLRVNVDDALKATTNQTIEALRAADGQGRITVRQISPISADTFEARGVDPAKDSVFRTMIEGGYPDYEITSSQGEVPNTYTLKMKARAAEEYRLQAVDQALRTIENRVNQLRRYGAGDSEARRARSAPNHRSVSGNRRSGKGKRASSASRRFSSSSSYTALSPAGRPHCSNLGAFLRQISRFSSLPRQRKAAARSYYVVHKVLGCHWPGPQERRRFPRSPERSPGRELQSERCRCAEVWAFDWGQRREILAIVLDSTVISAPTINSRITDTGIITGGGAGFAPEEARDLALVLKSGALPASMTTLQEAVVGASLGADSIRNGLIASVVALVSVIAFRSDLLQGVRNQRDDRHDPEPRYPFRLHGVVWSHPDPSGYRRRHSDDRYGYRLQCSDL